MANAYYQPGEQRAARVNELFGRIAPRYDLINDLQSFGLHRLWKRRLVQLSQARPGQRALDLCCGTGDIAFALARHGADVIGLDFSEPMLAIASRRAENYVSKNVPGRRPALPRFIRGDALHIPFPDRSFDIVTVGYGLRNLSEWKAGLREMSRVAKPGARILILDFGKPENALWRSFYFGYLRLVVPLFGLAFCRDAAAYAYILESLQHFPAQRGIDEELRSLGCRESQIIEPLGGIMGLNFALKP